MFGKLQEYIYALHKLDYLEGRLAKTEARAEEAESKYQKLDQSIKELQDTLEKLSWVVKHSRDSDLQLEHAFAAVDVKKSKICYTLLFLIWRM
ncbi:unnamed protein product [Brassica oleracea var. botrytis]